MEENKSYLSLLGAVILILALGSVVALGMSAAQYNEIDPAAGNVAEIATAMESAAVQAPVAEAVVPAQEAAVPAPEVAPVTEAAAPAAAATPATEAAATPVAAEATAAATEAAASAAESAAPPAEAATPGAAPQASDEVVATILKGGCVACHTIPGVPGAVGVVGPNLGNIGTDAATRVPGMTAEQYIHESLVNPLAFTAPACPFGPCVAGTMPMITATLSEDEINTIVAYLVTLHGGG